MRDPEAIVIGSGPNGLIAAINLLQHGLSVLVVEANPSRPGGAVGSSEATLPGFIHDFGAGFFPLARLSPAFRELPIERHGVQWESSEIASVHPALDGSSASILCGAAASQSDAAYFGSARDTAVWQKLTREYRGFEERLFAALFAPIPSLRPLFRLGLGPMVRLALWFATSTGRLARRWFESAAARRVLPGLALHSDLGPEDFAGGSLGCVLGFAASSVGYPVPRGGAQQLTNALVTLLELAGGQLLLGSRVERVVVRGKRASAVRLASGVEIAARRAIVADTSLGALFLELLSGAEVPWWALRAARRYRHAWGTFKVDWALSGPVPWRDENARRSATVHVGEDIADLVRYTREVRAGRLPARPYLVLGQQSLLDPTRAPPGGQTLYGYTHVPTHLDEDWSTLREAFADSIEARIEALAPGFRSLVLGRRLLSPIDLERADANLVGGDLGGGSNDIGQQLIFRPFFPNFRYRMPIPGLYLCSAATHPGGGAHGMCGYNAAKSVVADL
jgi:phytoene dehydrogenase-like protein